MSNIVTFAIACGLLKYVDSKSVISRLRESEYINGLDQLLGQLTDLKVYLGDGSSESPSHDFRKRASIKWPALRQDAAVAPTADVATNLSQLPAVDAEPGFSPPPVVSALPSNANIGSVVADELKLVLREQKTDLLVNPWVEKEGLNDFLVMRPIENDFHKIIPNDIFYKIENKCVNWLDKCSIKGIANRLLKRLQYPWRR